MLDAAATLFAERGYDNTSIEDVSERANLSKGTFYYHFASKEELVVQLRRSLVADSVKTAFDLSANGYAPLTVLEKLLVDRAVFTQRQPELSRVFYSQRIQQLFFKEDDIALKLDENGQPKRHFRRAIYELICEAQKLGQIRSDLSPQELTGMIVAFFLHAQGAWLSGERSSSLTDKVHRWFHALLDGVGDKGYREKAPCFVSSPGSEILL